jgi:peptidoglycan/xylan/chitin deacetylase (PgdA/CDA1 family)
MNPWLIGVPSAIVAGLAGLTSFSAADPRAQLFGPTVYRTNGPDQLALTFDDGPNPAITPKLLELLAKHNARATFFLVGKFVHDSPSLTKEIAAQGHTLGNHTKTHPNLFFCGPRETSEELQRCTDEIHQATWATPRWFRPPFGFRSPWVGEIALRQGMRTATWTLLPGDWRNKPAEWLIERMNPIAERAGKKLPVASDKGLTGDVLCLHDGDYLHPNGDRARTLAALEYWLPRWSDLGLKFVTMDETLATDVEA